MITDGSCYGTNSSKILKYPDARIRLIENFPCNTKKELKNREDEISRNTPNCINVIIIGERKSEYNRDKAREKSRKYREKNPERTKAVMKKWHEDNKEYEKEKRQIRNNIIVNCECGLSFKRPSLSGHLRGNPHLIRMKLSIEDREKISYDKNLYTRQRSVITCWCGEKISWACFAKHRKRKNCLL